MSKRVDGRAIGIDLGTTYSCVAIWLDHKNRVEIIPNEQGNRITPSYVAFNDSELLVGESAKNQIAFNEAGARAGFNVLRLLNEPTAAAIAYDVDNFSDNNWNKDKKTVLVFDLGGGTFDVSLLTISSKTGVIDVKAVGGDTHLGGQDFDATLVKYCINEFKKKNTGVNILGNPRALGRLKVACEKAKRDLSSTIYARIEIDYKDIDFSAEIHRAKFEELNATYFDKCIQLLQECLRDGEMKKMDVDEVVLVGGSSRIPKVQKMVEEFLGKTLCRSLNGDEAVASGAAILAARLSGNYKMQDVVLLDVIPRSVGIETLQTNRVRGNMKVIIPKNTSIPTSKKTMVYSVDNNTTTGFHVYQGENAETKDNILLDKFNLDGLKPDTNGVSQIEVCFNLDIHGILLVSAEELSTGLRNSITITKI